jgi:PiT family inorganic phosphate transporter
MATFHELTRHTRVLEIVGDTIRVKGKGVAFGELAEVENVDGETSLAIAVGVFYSKPVMMTVGNSIMPVSPVGAWVVVMAQSMVLFIFSSNELLGFVVSLGLPPYPLIPVSSSQAVIGAVIGIGLTHGWAGVGQIKWRVLANIGSGWVSTPIVAAAISFFFLFFLQNVFQQEVYQEVRYQLSDAVIENLSGAGVVTEALEDLRGQEILSAAAFTHCATGPS